MHLHNHSSFHNVFLSVNSPGSLVQLAASDGRWFIVVLFVFSLARLWMGMVGIGTRYRGTPPFGCFRTLSFFKHSVLPWQLSLTPSTTSTAALFTTQAHLWHFRQRHVEPAESGKITFGQVAGKHPSRQNGWIGHCHLVPRWMFCVLARLNKIQSSMD